MGGSYYYVDAEHSSTNPLEAGTAEITADYTFSGSSEDIYAGQLYLGEGGAVLSPGKAAHLALDDNGLGSLELPLAGVLFNLGLTAIRPAYADKDYALSPTVTLTFDNGAKISGSIAVEAGSQSGTGRLAVPAIKEFENAESFSLSFGLSESAAKSDKLIYDYDEIFLTDGGLTTDGSKSAVYPIGTKEIDFTAWDNSALLADAVNNGSVTSEVKDAVVDSETGVVTVTLSVSNDLYGVNSFSGSALLAEYDPEGYMLSLKREVYTVTRDLKDGTLTLKLELENGYNSKNTYKLLLWDNTAFMHPISEPVVIVNK